MLFSAMERALSTFIRAWLLRIQKRIALSYTVPYHPAPLLQEEDTRAPAQRLPAEIVLQILCYLLCSMQEVVSSPTLSGSAASALARKLERDQLFLLWASKSCRSWYTVGSELLYSSPVLSDTRRMELFERTLTESPSLARFVKAVYAPILTSNTTSELFGWIWGRRSTKAQQQELTSLLHTCPSLHSLTIRHTVRKGLVSLTPIDEVIHRSELEDKLEHLTIHGSSFEARWHPQMCVLPPLSDVLLPHLRVLCLRGIYVLPTMNLPDMPKLHTLQLIDNHYFASSSVEPVFSSETLPNLRNVEIVRNHFQGQPDLRLLFDEECTKSIARLSYIDDEHCMAITRSIPPDGGMQHLMLGMLCDRDRVDVACWRVPDGLRSLTFVLRQANELRNTAAAVRDCLDAVARCVEVNEDAKSLRAVTIIGVPPEVAKLSNDSDSGKALKTACDSRRISLQFEPYGESINLLLF